MEEEIIQTFDSVASFFGRVFSAFYDGPFLLVMSEIENFEDVDVPYASDWFGLIVCATVLTAFLVAFCYYIKPINHPRFKSWWSWLIMLGTTCLLCVLETWAFANVRVSQIGSISMGASTLDQLETEDGQTGIDYLSNTHLLGFIWGDVKLAICAFIVASLCFFAFSTNAKWSPFRK